MFFIVTHHFEGIDDIVEVEREQGRCIYCLRNNLFLFEIKHARLVVNKFDIYMYILFVRGFMENVFRVNQKRNKHTHATE